MAQPDQRREQGQPGEQEGAEEPQPPEPEEPEGAALQQECPGQQWEGPEVQAGQQAQ